MTWTPMLIIRALELGSAIVMRVIEAERKRRNVAQLTDEEAIAAVAGIKIEEVDTLIARGAAGGGDEP